VVPSATAAGSTWDMTVENRLGVIALPQPTL